MRSYSVALRVRELSANFRPYEWALATVEVARIAGIRPDDVLRFDANTAPGPPHAARTGAISHALERIHGYPHGGYPELVAAVAEYAGAEPANVVLGAGADDLILLAARTFAGPGDRVAIADEPTYPLYRVATWLAGAEVGDEDPVVTFCCRPHNPTGALGEIPAARPLIVDEAYFEYCGETAALLDGVVAIRTLSKAFALAGARVGYALAEPEIARELNARQAPAPVSTLFRCARARRPRRAARRPAPAGGARAACSPPACARARAAGLGDQLPLRAVRAGVRIE